MHPLHQPLRGGGGGGDPRKRNDAPNVRRRIDTGRTHALMAHPCPQASDTRACRQLYQCWMMKVPERGLGGRRDG